MSLMRKALDVVGLPILCLTTGREIGVVRDILCDVQWSLLGFVTKEASWFQKGMYIPLQKVCAVGDDYLTVLGADTEVPLHTLTDQDTIGLATGQGKLKGKPVVTRAGKLLGTIEDVYFSSDWEKLVGYELSNGWIADLTEGRKRLPAPSYFMIGEEAMVVSNSVRIQA